MVNANGTIILNGVTDKQMETIWGFKARHEGKFSFTPNVMQANQTPRGTVYNNVQFGYSNVDALNVVTQVVNHLANEEKQVATGQ